MIRRLGCINAILLGGVAFGVVHLWLSWACCHRCKSQSPGAQCCCPVIRLRFVCALVRLTDSIAPDHYTGAKGNVQRAHAIEQPAPERLNIFSCCGQCLQLSVVLASAEWHLQLSECCSRDFRGTCFVPVILKILSSVPVILRQNGREQNILSNFTPLRRMTLAHRRKVHSAHVYLDHSWIRVCLSCSMIVRMKFRMYFGLEVACNDCFR